MKLDHGIGATSEFSLRVSVATLIRVVFTNEENEQQIALERKGTFHEREQAVVIRTQPFGGAVRINDPSIVEEITGGFCFDSEGSRAEQDFRIFIRPSAWERVKAYCLDQFQASEEAAFETSPARELAEEIHDSLGIQIEPGQYYCIPLWMALENVPTSTRNIHAVHQPTVRLYGIFESQITDPALWQKLVMNSTAVSGQDLRRHVLEDRQRGGKGRANACIVFPMETLGRYYESMPLEERNRIISFEGMELEENIPALLDSVASPRFQRIKLG